MRGLKRCMPAVLIASRGIAVASEKPGACSAEVVIAEAEAAVTQASARRAPRFRRAMPRPQSSRHGSHRISPCLE
jgi:hypothetical protein